METNQHSIPEILADTKKWELIIRAPYPVQLNMVRFLNVRQLFIAHYSFPELRLAIQNPSQPYKKINLTCNVDVHERSVIVYEISNKDKSDEHSKEVFSMETNQMEQDNKDTLVFGHIDSGTDIVYCQEETQGIVNILSRIRAIWPTCDLELVVQGKVPKEYLLSSALQETLSLTIKSDRLFEDIDAICLHAKKVKRLILEASLHDNFNLQKVLKIEDVHFCDAKWLTVSHLTSNLELKKATFAETELKSKHLNTILQQKNMCFADITITLKYKVEIEKILKDIVYLSVNHTFEQDAEIQEDEKADELEKKYYLSHYMLTRQCDKEEWNLLRVFFMDLVASNGKIKGKTLVLQAVPTSSFPRTFEVLNCLNEKKTTKAEIQRLTDEIELATVDLEAYGGTESQCEEAEKLKKLLAEHNNEKKKMMEKLEAVEKDLSAPDIACQDGFYDLHRP